MPAAVKDSPNKVFVSNMPKSWSDDKFQSTFEVYGKIVEADLKKNRETGQSRGFGFITYVSEIDASDAIQGMNGKEIDGCTLKVDAALKSLHASGGDGERGRGRGRGMRGGMRGGPMRGRGGPLLRGGPRGGFSPRGGPVMRGRGGPPRGGMGQDGESSFRGRGGGFSRGMGRGGMDGGPPSRGGRGAPRGGPRGAPRGGPRGAPLDLMGRGGRGGAGRALMDRPPVDDYEQEAGYGAPRGGRSLLGKEPLLSDPGAQDFRGGAQREPRGRPEREPDSYRAVSHADAGLLPTRTPMFGGQFVDSDDGAGYADRGMPAQQAQAQFDAPPTRRNGPGYSDRGILPAKQDQFDRPVARRNGPSFPEGGLLPTRQAQYDGPQMRRDEPLLREREPLAPRPAERGFQERSRASFGAEREGAGFGARAAAQYPEESFGAAGRGGRDSFAAGGRAAAASLDYAEARPARSEFGAADSFRRDQYGAGPTSAAAARPARDSYVERDYAPPARSVDPYGAPQASASGAARGYGGAQGREQALAREPALPRETPRGGGGREALLAQRDYAPARAAGRDYGEARREEPQRDYARASRAAYPEERASGASYGSRSFDEYEKPASRGYGAGAGGADAYGSARDPAGSAPTSRAAYSSRDAYPSSGRGDRAAEKPGYGGDQYRGGPSYGGRSAPSDRNGGGSSRPYSRY